MPTIHIYRELFHSNVVRPLCLVGSKHIKTQTQVFINCLMLLHPSAQQDMLTQVLGSQVTPGFLNDVVSYNSLTTDCYSDPHCYCVFCLFFRRWFSYRNVPPIGKMFTCRSGQVASHRRTSNSFLMQHRSPISSLNCRPPTMLQTIW